MRRTPAHAQRTVAWVGQVADVGDDGLRLAEEQADGAGRELGRGAEAGRLRAEEAPELGAAGGERRRADPEDVADARGQAERGRRAAGQRRERRRRLHRRLLRRGQRRRRDRDDEGESHSHLEPPPRHGGTQRGCLRRQGRTTATRLHETRRRGCTVRDAEGDLKRRRWFIMRRTVAKKWGRDGGKRELASPGGWAGLSNSLWSVSSYWSARRECDLGFLARLIGERTGECTSLSASMTP
jgi:hypothetical protein